MRFSYTSHNLYCRLTLYNVCADGSGLPIARRTRSVKASCGLKPVECAKATADQIRGGRGRVKTAGKEPSEADTSIVGELLSHWNTKVMWLHVHLCSHVGYI